MSKNSRTITVDKRTSKAFHCIYPIKEGNVVLLKNTRLLQCSALNYVSVPHQTYLWFQREFKRQPGVNPRDRKVRVLYCYVPSSPIWRNFYQVQSRVVQLDSMVRAMKDGYELIAQEIEFNYTDTAYKPFYIAIGLMDGELRKDRTPDRGDPRTPGSVGGESHEGGFQVRPDNDQENPGVQGTGEEPLRCRHTREAR